MVQRYIFHSIPNTLHYSSEIHPYVGEFRYLCTNSNELMRQGVGRTYLTKGVIEIIFHSQISQI